MVKFRVYKHNGIVILSTIESQLQQHIDSNQELVLILIKKKKETCINNFVMIDQQLRREVTAYWCGNGRRYKPKAS